MEINSLPSANENLSDYDPQLDAEDQALSSGNTRLGLVVGALLLAGVLSYALVPKQSGDALGAVMPSFLLEAANVTASRAPDAAPAARPEAAGAPAKVADPLPAVAGAEATRPAVAPAVAAPALLAPALVAVAAPPVPVPEPVRASVAPISSTGPVTLTGRILNEEGKPLVGATVLLKGSGKGTGTDANGNYKLEAPAGDNTLIFGYGGYQDEEAHTRGAQLLNVTLTPMPSVKHRR